MPRVLPRIDIKTAVLHPSPPGGGEVPGAQAPRASNAHEVRREKESEQTMAGQKIRIRLKSYDHEVIDSSARKIVDTVTRAGATVVGPVPLPTEKNVIAVIRSS